MPFLSFFNSPTKGCFYKNGNAFWGKNGTEDEKREIPSGIKTRSECFLNQASVTLFDYGIFYLVSNFNCSASSIVPTVFCDLTPDPTFSPTLTPTINPIATNTKPDGLEEDGDWKADGWEGDGYKPTKKPTPSPSKCCARFSFVHLSVYLFSSLTDTFIITKPILFADLSPTDSRPDRPTKSPTLSPSKSLRHVPPVMIQQSIRYIFYFIFFIMTKHRYHDLFVTAMSPTLSPSFSPYVYLLLATHAMTIHF